MSRKRTKAVERASDRIHHTAIGTCPACGKGVYRNRKHARAAAKHYHPNEKMVAYECAEAPVDGIWHYGHDHSWRHRFDADRKPAPPEACKAMAAIHRAATKPST